MSMVVLSGLVKFMSLAVPAHGVVALFAEKSNLFLKNKKFRLRLLAHKVLVLGREGLLVDAILPADLLD